MGCHLQLISRGPRPCSLTVNLNRRWGINVGPESKFHRPLGIFSLSMQPMFQAERGLPRAGTIGRAAGFVLRSYPARRGGLAADRPGKSPTFMTRKLDNR